MKKILVTGGAGYIGSHAVKALCDNGFAVTVLDNLSKGHEGALDKRAEFIMEDLKNFEFVNLLMGERKFDAVMHFAGSTEVGISMLKPRDFIINNVLNGANLLEAVRLNGGVTKIIFSSTAAVYGNPVSDLIKETDPKDPTNIYGMTKLMFEDLLRKYDEFFGVKFVALRYFNAAGADDSAVIGEDHEPETHLIPNVLGSVLGGTEGGLKIFGTDYPTKDGTCVRDYIHVTDLVDAHLKALDYLLNGGESDVFNLGNGSGFSVMEVVEAARKVTGFPIPYTKAPRREGDPAVLVADSSKAGKVLGWKPVHTSMESIINTAWKWHKSNPKGYGK